MPTLAYHYVPRGNLPAPPPGLPTCPGGPGAGLIMPGPIQPGWPQLYNAQLRIGVYVGPPWDLPEMQWRMRSLDLATNRRQGSARASCRPVRSSPEWMRRRRGSSAITPVPRRV